MDPDRRRDLFTLVADVVAQRCDEVDPVAAELIRAARALQPSLDYLLLERLLSADAAARASREACAGDRPAERVRVASPRAVPHAPSGSTGADGVPGVRRPD